MHILKTSALIRELASGALSERHKVGYLIGGSVAYIVFAFLGQYVLNISGPSNRAIATIEALVAVVVTAVGILICHRQMRNIPGARFVEIYVCLSLPILVQATLMAWACYFLLSFLLEKSLPFLTFSSEGESEAAAAVMTFIFRLIPSISMLVGLFLFFFLMYRALKRMAGVSERSK